MSTPNHRASLCRLVAGVDRFAVSVLWEFDDHMNLLPDRTWMGRTIIRSKYALTYDQVRSQPTTTCPVCVQELRAWFPHHGYHQRRNYHHQHNRRTTG